MQDTSTLRDLTPAMGWNWDPLRPNISPHFIGCLVGPCVWFFFSRYKKSTYLCFSSYYWLWDQKPLWDQEQHGSEDFQCQGGHRLLHQKLLWSTAALRPSHQRSQWPGSHSLNQAPKVYMLLLSLLSSRGMQRYAYSLTMSPQLFNLLEDLLKMSLKTVFCVVLFCIVHSLTDNDAQYK